MEVIERILKELRGLSDEDLRHAHEHAEMGWPATYEIALNSFSTMVLVEMGKRFYAEGKSD